MSPSSTRETYRNVLHEAEVDGGWSGQLRIVLGNGISDEELVFVDSDLLGPRRLVLTPEEAAETGSALTKASRKAQRVVAGDVPTPRVHHQWEVDVMPSEPAAPLVLWRDGQYVAHLDVAAAEALASILRMRSEEVSAATATTGGGGPAEDDVDAVRGLLDLMEQFADNDQRARYLLSSNWLRDRGAAAAARVRVLSAVESTL